MAAVKVRALQECFTAEQRFVEKGQEFTWYGDVDELPDYLEQLEEATLASPPPQRELSIEQRAARIIEILQGFDHGNDELWTSEGDPRMDAIHAQFGDESVTRAEVRAVAPEIIRST